MIYSCLVHRIFISPLFLYQHLLRYRKIRPLLFPLTNRLSFMKSVVYVDYDSLSFMLSLVEKQ
jgi:hypothetical protein